MTATFKVTNGDVVINRSSGQPELVRRDTKLRQDLRIALATSARADNVGAGIEDVLTGQAATAQFVQRAIQRRVRNMVAAIQDLQDRWQRNQRSREERLLRAQTIQVSTTAQDPTAFIFKADFVSGADPTRPIRLSGRIT